MIKMNRKILTVFLLITILVVSIVSVYGMYGDYSPMNRRGNMHGSFSRNFNTEQKQTTHLSVQSVSPEIKISDSFKIRDFEDDETGFSSVSPPRKSKIFWDIKNQKFLSNPKQTAPFKVRYKSEGVGDNYNGYMHHQSDNMHNSIRFRSSYQMPLNYGSYKYRNMM